MDADHEDQTNTGGEQRGDQEVEDGPEGDHAGHLGVETRGAGDQTRDHQGQDHQLEEPHEELARVGDDVDGEGVQLIIAKGQTSQNTFSIF